ncbi:MAG TPA: hypothetical protein PKB03_10675 [Baekduia sp.]|nr:hypothetical protein [Baekduia sp.]
MSKHPDFLADVLSRFLRGETVDRYLAPGFVGAGGLLGSAEHWYSVDEVSSELRARGAEYAISVTEQAELGDGRVFLCGVASRRRPGCSGFTTTFGAIVTLRDGLIQSIQTSDEEDAVRSELGLTAPQAGL